MINDNVPVELTDCAVNLANMRADRDGWKKHAQDMEKRWRAEMEVVVKLSDMLAKFQEEVAGQYGSAENEAQI